jgi:branched-chain amino acid transport system permease protein
MHPFILMALSLPSWQDEQPFLVTGLALGGVYALSGVGMIVLYRTTGVLNLSFGAVGAFGALIAWQLINHSGMNQWLAYLMAILVAGVLTLAYGMVFGRALADRDPLVKTTATLGLTLILLGVMDLLWTSNGGASRAITLPTDNHGFMIGQIQVTTTDVIGLAIGVAITVLTTAFLRFSKLGTAMRAMANDREITATLGRGLVRVRDRLGRGRDPARRSGGARRHHVDLPGDLVAGRGPDRSAELDRRHVRGRDRDRRGRRLDHADRCTEQLP